jgi:hypothetical protein
MKRHFPDGRGEHLNVLHGGKSRYGHLKPPALDISFAFHYGYFTAKHRAYQQGLFN